MRDERWTIFEARRSGGAAERRRRPRPTTWPTKWRTASCTGASEVADGATHPRRQLGTSCPAASRTRTPEAMAEAVAALHHLGAVSPCTCTKSRELSVECG